MRLARPRRIAVGVTAAVVATTFAWLPGSPTVGAATTTFTCKGITGDVAGQVAGTNKSSKELLELLASLGGSAELTLPVGVTVNAPSSVATGSGPFDVSFVYDIALPDSLVNSARDLLKVSSLKVENASFGIDVSGAATTTVVGTIPSIDVSLATTPVTVSQTISGSVEPSTSGLVYFRPGATQLSVVVNGSAGGVATIGTITVTCAASGLLGSTAVRPPGSPIINPSPLSVNVAAGASATVNLDDGSLVTPDEGNPIEWSSLRLAGNPTGGTATLAGRTINYTAPAANGSYDVTFEVCGAPRSVVGSPGTDEVQTLAFADARYSRDFPNAHPLAFTLKFGGQETAPIITSFVDVDIFGNITTFPYLPGDELSRNVHILGGRFAPPSAATVRAALEALPNVAPGDLEVTGGPTNLNDLTVPYTITFTGELATTDVDQVTIGLWDTWLPNEGLQAVLDAASQLGGGAGGGTVPPTVEESFAALVNQTISVEQFWTQVWDRVRHDIIQGIDIQGILDAVLQMFPKTPVTATTVTGEPVIPDSSTGLLCSQGVIQFVVTGGTNEAPSVAGTATDRPSSGARAAGATAVQSDPRFAG